MAKVLEGPGMGLMKKWGIPVPNYLVRFFNGRVLKVGRGQ